MVLVVVVVVVVEGGGGGGSWFGRRCGCVCSRGREQRRWRGGKDELGCDDVWRPSDQQLDEFKQMREEEQRVN